jgi:hypothetical protein
VSDSLVQFVRDRLCEDAQIARAACWDEQSDAWTYRSPQGADAKYERHTIVDYCGDGVVVVVTPENADAEGVGRHVARHDPARVLSEVEAKRLLLAEHLPLLLSSSQRFFCDCQAQDGVITALYPCLTVQLLALPHADHADYREEWRPTAE